MKQLIVAIAIIFIALLQLVECFGQDANEKYNDNEAQNVALKARIISKKEVKIDDDVLKIEMKLMLNYTNIGYNPKYIYKNWSEISHIWIAQNNQDLCKKEYLLSVSNSVLTEGGKGIDDLTLNDFVMLGPNESYESEGFVNVFVRKSDDLEFAGSLLPGIYRMAIQVDTWRWDSKSLDRIQSEFQIGKTSIVSTIVSKPIYLSLVVE